MIPVLKIAQIPMTPERIHKAAAKFVHNGGPIHVESLGEGNINDTYLVRSAGDVFVLQSINDKVFPSPHLVVENFFTLTRYLKNRLEKLASQWEIIVSIPTVSGEKYYRDEGGRIWRAQSFLEQTVTHTVIETPHRARQVGWALGRFHSLFTDLPGSTLQQVLPGFHNLPQYMQAFEKAVLGHKRPSSTELSHCLHCIGTHPYPIDFLERLKTKKGVTTQVIHGDPKVDNVLFSNVTDMAKCLIDLDTVGSGLLLSDIGDCLRSCCNSSGEKKGEGGSVHFDVEMCRQILKGYYPAAGNIVTRHDREHVFEAVVMLTFELGVRFLSDYLVGNRYFKVRYEEENLHRSFRQFQLVENILEQEKSIRRVAEEL